MNTHLYRIFKKVVAIVLALLLISADTLQYAYAAVDEYQQEAVTQSVSSQENIDNNKEASDDKNGEQEENKNEEKEEDKTSNSNDTTTEDNETSNSIKNTEESSKDNSKDSIDKEESSDKEESTEKKSTKNENTIIGTTKASESEDVNQELVVKVGQESNMSNRDISILTGQTVRIHVTSTGSNANIVGDYKIRMEITNPNVILSDFQNSDGTMRDEVILDGAKLRLVTTEDGKRYIISELTQGSTHQFDFQMIFKNGVTQDGEKVIIKTDILDSKENVVTNQVTDEKCVISDLTVTANASFNWNDISKTVNKQNVDRDTSGSIKDESVVYTIKATSQNNGHTGKIFTKEYTVTDELELPESINLPSGDISSSNGILTIGGKKILEVSESNAKITVEGKKIKITYTKTNSSNPDSEIAEPNMQVTLYTSNLIAEKSRNEEIITNKASFEAKPVVGDNNETSQDTVTTTVPAVAPKITAKKSSDVVDKEGSDVEVGNIIKYEITVQNEGGIESDSFVVEDMIPTNTEATNKNEWTDGYTLENNKVKWNVSGLESGAKKTYVFYVKVTECDSQTLIRNTATVDNKNTNETTNRVITPSANIQLNKYANESYKTYKDGDRINYTVEVSNIGDLDSKEQTIIDTMPAGLVPEYDESTKTIKSGEFTGTVEYDPLNKQYTITWNIGVVKKGGEKLALTYNARVDFSNLPVGIITGEEKTIDLVNRVTNNDKTAQASIKVGLDGYNIGVDKQSSSKDIREGQSVTYTLTVSNTGSQQTTIDVKDILPVDKNGNVIDWWTISDNPTITTSGDLDSYNLTLENGVLTWKDVTIEVGQTINQTVILTYPEGEKFTSLFEFNRNDSIVNKLTVGDKQSTTSQTPKDVDLEINKSVDKESVKIGSDEDVTFTIDGFSNTSKKSIENLTVRDDFSSWNGVNSKFTIKEITTGSYEGINSYNIEVEFTDYSKETITIDNASNVSELSSLLNGKKIEDVRTIKFNFGNVGTDFKVVKGITVVTTSKSSDEIEAGTVINTAVLNFNKTQISDDANVEVIYPETEVTKEAYVDGKLADNKTNPIAVGDTVTFKIKYTNNTGKDINANDISFSDNFTNDTIIDKSKELKVKVRQTDSNGKLVTEDPLVLNNVANWYYMNFSFTSGVLKNGETIELDFDAVTAYEYSKAEESVKDGQTDYRLHNTIDLKLKNNVVAEDETDYYYPARTNNIWTQKGIKSIGEYTKNSDGQVNGTYTAKGDSLYTYNSNQNAIVYTYVIYNDVNSPDNLPLKKAVDILPNGFKYIAMSGISNTFNNVNSSNQITTLNYANDVNLPQGVTLDGGITVNAAYDDNNKITFTFNDGAELQPGHAITFSYLCEIDRARTDSSSTNKIAFAYSKDDKEAPGNDVQSKFSTNTDKSPKNDGTCSILNENYDDVYGDENATWYESDVTIKKTSIFPGISKKLNGFYDSGSDELHEVDENSKIGIKSSLKWTIKVNNNGNNYDSDDMTNYTVIDTLPHPYTLSQNSKHTQSMTIYNKDGSKKSTLDISELLTKSTKIDSNGQEVQVLTWKLEDQKYTIPGGGYAEITFISANDTNTANYGTYVNNAALVPTQSFTKDSVTEGNVTNVEIDGEKTTGIENQASAHIFGNYATYSFKQISDLSGYDKVLDEDKSGNGYGDNHANGYGYKANDDTVISSGVGEKVGYTLYVKSNCETDIYNLTLIDKLPHVGDVGTVNLNSYRNSEFTVYLANNPNFKVDILDEDRNYESTVDPSQYSIDYSNKVSYTNEDWDSNTTWDASYNQNIHKSLRLTFKNGFVLKSGKIVRVYFEGSIGDDAIPGEIAWNSFGYLYSARNSFNEDVTLIAEPAKVGVSIPGTVDSAQISITKVDENRTDKILEGAEFGVYSNKECTDLITKITTTSNGEDLSSKLLLKTYYVKEIEAPEGYIKDDTVYTVNLTEKDSIVKVQKDSTGYVTNQKEKRTDIRVQISKKDAVTSEALPGATLQVIDKSNKVVDEWVSTDQPYEINTLEPGEYTLVEKSAPEGYLTAKPLDFIVEETSEIQEVNMFDSKDVSLFVKKTLTAENQFSSDSEFNIVINGEFSDGSEEKTITFTKEDAVNGVTKEVKNVIYGNTYTISENNADSYDVAITNNGQVEVNQKNQLVQVINSKKLSGILAVIKNVENTKTVADDEVFTLVVNGEFSDGTSSKEITITKENLNKSIIVENTVYGETYTVSEINNENYDVVYDTESVTLDGSLQPKTLSVTNTRKESGKLSVVKQMADDAIISDADSFVVLVKGIFSDVEGETTKRFTFNKNNIGQAQQVPGVIYGNQYEISEEQTGSKYVLDSIDKTSVTMGAEDVVSTITNRKITGKVTISKTNITTGEPVEGAKLQIIDKVTNNIVEEWTTTNEEHQINKLPIGDYILRETQAPDGYLVAEDVEFTVSNSEEIQKVEMKDDYTKVQISKKDLANQEVLSGAKLQLLNSAGKVVADFVSDEEAHVINRLPAGTYTLHEVEAPKGYNLAKDIEVVVEAKSEVQEFTMYDAEKTNDVPISKQDITTGEEIEGAKLQLLNSKGEEVDSWTSTDKPHVVNNLKAGTYTIKETQAPEGYLIAEEIQFTIDSEGNITGSTIMRDDYTKVEISKQDITTGEELPGAKLQVKDAEGNLVEEWTNGEEPHRIDRLPVGDYTLVETQAPNGYLVAEEVQFTVKEDGEIQKVEMQDDYTKVEITKSDITTGESVVGAKLQVIDKTTERVVEEWTTTEEAYKIDRLPVGEYILRETQAPDGYVRAEDVEFTVDESGEIQQVEMEDDYTKVEITKRDLETKEILEGAKLELLDSEGKVVAEFTSENKAYEMTKLPVGEYTLHEVEAPTGYNLAEDIKVVVEEKAEVQAFVMYDAQKTNNVPISKQDITTGEEIEGAELELLNSKGEVVESWTSTDKPHVINDLKAGTYTIKETQAPEGYLIAEEVEFTIDSEGNITGSTIMKDDYTKVEITKKDLETKEILEGAKLELLDSEGKVVAEFTSENKAYEITKLPVGEYTLHEVEAPKGYNLAEDIKVVVEEKAEVQAFVMYDAQKTNNVPISKQDITTGEEIEGAKLELLNSKGEVVESWTSTDKPYVVNNLKAGTYKIKETQAPEGYLIAEEVEFTIDSEGNITGSTIMKDDYTKVDIKKSDITDGTPVIGATLQIKDAEGNVVEEWVTTEESHRIDRLPVGDYTLVETQAPDGYLVAEEVKFTVDENDQIQKVEMKDDYTKVEITKSDITDGKPVEGAKLEVIDKTTGETVEEWTTTDKPHRIDRLPEGEYILRETTAPDGYVRAEDVEFKVDKTGEIQKVEMKDDYTKVEITKRDLETKEILEGAKLELLDSKGKVVAEFTSENKAYEMTKLPVGEYTLHEVEAPKGYNLAEDIKVVIEEKAEVQAFVMYDAQKTNNVPISKQDITTGEEIEGAKLELLNSKGEVIESWTSTDKPYVVNNLKAGTYKIKETQAPEGYLIAEEVEFTIDSEGNITGSTIMKDDYTKVDIKKSDITDGTPVIGATLQIKDAEGNVVEEWVTTEESHRIDRLPVGDYTLVETQAPDGYLVAEEVKFTVDETGEIQKVEMKDDYTKVEITKSDITDGKPVEGAKLEVIDKITGETVEEWTTTDKPHRIDRLPEGEYILRETTAPDGYVRAEDVEFKVDKTGEIQKVEMKDDYTKVEITKRDLETKEILEGAKLELLDSKGKVVAEFTSENKAYEMTKLPVGEYTLHEVKAPKGYNLAEDVKVVVEEKAEVQAFAMYDVEKTNNVPISKQDITTGEEIEGAKLELLNSKEEVVESWTSTDKPHVVNNLKAGTYTIKETQAPEGYLIAEEVEFTIDSEGNITGSTIMKDDYTKVQISKKDIVTSEELAGATLQVKDSNGKVIEEWVSTTEPHRIDRLPVGDYTLVEIQAPNGYLIAENVKFTVTETGEIQQVEMFDAKDVSLYVKKDVSNIDKLKGDEEFTIKVSGKFTDGSTEKYIKFTYDELGKEKIVSDVIYGNEYNVSEPKHEGYKVQIDKENVVLMESKEVVTVTNTLETPENPDTPDVPNVPDKPDTPDSPDEPNVPDEPNTPGNPEQPENPDVNEDGGNNVKTGDNGLVNEIAIGSIAILALVVLLINDRRRKNS